MENLTHHKETVAFRVNYKEFIRVPLSAQSKLNVKGRKKKTPKTPVPWPPEAHSQEQDVQ